jgi:Amidohydrolase
MPMTTTRRAFLRATAVGVTSAALPARAQPTSPASPIDFHAHWIGPHVVELLGKRSSPRPPQGQGWFDIDARLRQMDEAGVQRQVLSYVGASYDGVMPPDEARPFWRAQNDDVAALVKKHPARFSGLATLPTANVAWAADELQRRRSDPLRNRQRTNLARQSDHRVRETGGLDDGRKAADSDRERPQVDGG